MAHLTPLYPFVSSPDSAQPSPNGVDHSGDRRPHILVMNDDQPVLDLFQELLEEEGYRVTTSIHMLDMEKVRNLAPDVIVQDIMFEGGSKGWPFITMARMDRQLRTVPIILCTAAIRTVEPMLERLTAQHVLVIYKPFQLDELLTMITVALPATAHGST